MVDVTSRLRLVVDSRGVDKSRRGLAKLTKQSKRATKSAHSLRSAYAGLSAVLGGALSGAGLLKTIDLFNTQAKGLAKVEQAIFATGSAAGFTAKELEKVAGGLQNVTLYGDDEILNGVTAQLLTFTNIANEEFLRTQMIAMDLSTVLDGDLKSASIQLGKALNDPVTQLSALSRSGIMFTKSQRDLVKELWEVGKQAEAQQLILAELERQYGGQAEKAALIGSAALTQLKNVLGDIGELMGEKLFAMIQPGVEALRDFFSIAENREKTVQVIAGIGTALAIAFAPTVVAGIAAIGGALLTFSLPVAAVGAAIGALIVYKDDIAEWAFGVADAGAVVRAAFEVLAPMFTSVYDSIRSFVGGVFDEINSLRKAVMGIIPDGALKSITDFASNAIKIFANFAAITYELITDALLLPLKLVDEAMEKMSQIDLLPDGVQDRLKEVSATIHEVNLAFDNMMGRENIDRTAELLTGVVTGTKRTLDEISQRAREIHEREKDLGDAKEETNNIERERTEEMAEQVGLSQDLVRELENQQEAIAGLSTNVGLQLRDELVDAAVDFKYNFIENGFEAVDDFGDYLKDTIKRAFNAKLFNQLIAPVLQNVFGQQAFQALGIPQGAVNVPGVLSGGATGGGVAGGAGSGAGFGMPGLDVLGAVKALFTGGGLSGAMSSLALVDMGIAAGTGTANLLAGLGLSGSTAAGIGNFVGAGVANAPFAMAGSFIGKQFLGLEGSGNGALDFGLQTAGSFGGGALGAAAIGGTFGGPIGAALGAIAGLALGGLFKNDDYPFGKGNLDVGPGGFDYDFGRNLDGFKKSSVDKMGEAIQTTLNDLVSAIGGSFSGSKTDLFTFGYASGRGKRLGKGFFGGSGQVDLSSKRGPDLPDFKNIKDEQEFLLKTVLGALREGIEGGFVDGLGSTVQKVIETFNGSLADLEATLNAAQAIDEMLGTTGEPLSRVEEELKQINDLFDDLAGKLGAVTAVETARTIALDQYTSQTIDSILGAASEPLSRVEQELKSVNELFDALATNLSAVAKVEAARATALEQIGDKYNKSIDEQLAQFLNSPADNLNRLLEAQESRYEEAGKAGADLDKVARLSALEQRSFFESLSDEALKEVESFLGLFDAATNSVVRNLDLSRQDLTSRAQNFGVLAQDFSDLDTDFASRFIAQSPRESVDVLRGRASELLSQLNGGNESAAQALPQVLNQLVSSARSTFGNSQSFVEILSFARDVTKEARDGALANQSDAEKQIAALDENNTILADIRDILKSADGINALFSAGVSTSDDLLALIQGGTGLSDATANATAATLSITSLIAQSMTPVISPMVQSMSQFTERLANLPSLQQLTIEAVNQNADTISTRIEDMSEIMDRMETVMRRQLIELEQQNAA